MYFKAKPTMIVLSLLLFSPLPTPTPIPLVEAQDEFTKGAQSIQAVANALSTFTPLMTLVLGLVVVLVFIVVWGRKQNNIQPLLNSIEKDREERQKLFDKLNERDKDRETKTHEAVEALAIANQDIRKVVIALETKETQQGDILSKLTSVIEAMATKGSQPVQEIGARLEHIEAEGTKSIRALQDSIENANKAIKDIESPDGAIVTILTRIEKQIEDMRRELQSKIEDSKRKTDSKPIVKLDEVKVIPTEGSA